MYAKQEDKANVSDKEEESLTLTTRLQRSVSTFLTILEPILTKRAPMTSPNPNQHLAICTFRPNFGPGRGRPRFDLEDPDDAEARYQSIRTIFDDICYIRHKNLYYYEPQKDVTFLYKAQESAVATLAKSAASVGICHEFFEDIGETQMDFGNAPAKFFQSLSTFLDHKTLLGCRLVCYRWDRMLTSTPQFLNRILYIVNESLDFVERCKTQVTWPHVKTHFFPTVETLAVTGYGQKYLVNKLHKIETGRNPLSGGWKGGAQQRQFFLLSTVSSLILVNVELNRDIFMKWLAASSGALNSVELQSCILKVSQITRAGLNGRGEKEGTLSSGGISSIKASNMGLPSLTEFLKLVQLVGSRLKVLEIGSKVPLPRSGNDQVYLTRKSKAEQELSKLLLDLVRVHGRTLESLEISLAPFVSVAGIPQFFQRLANTLAHSPGAMPFLKNFGFRVMTGSGSGTGSGTSASTSGWRESLVRDRRTVGFTGPAEVGLIMENIARCGSGTLKRINVPFWTVQGPQNLEMASNLAILLPKLSQLGAQFDFLPCQESSNSQPLFEEFDLDDLENLQKSTSQDINENYKNLKAFRKIERAGHAPSRGLTKLCIYTAFSSATLKKCFPWLRELELDFGAGTEAITPSDFQGIIQWFPKLVKLSVGVVKGFEDITLMGVEPPVMKILKERSLARIKAAAAAAATTARGQKTGNDGDMKQRFPVSRMRKLRILRIRGQMEMTDVGMLHSFDGMRDLEVLELSGSTLNVSATGLHAIGLNCPNLREMVMSLSKDTVKEESVAEILELFPLLQPGRGRINVV